MRKITITFLMTLVFMVFGINAQAATVSWTDWTSATTTTATGTVAGITVNFTGSQSPTSQTSGGVNYWATNSAIYRSPSNGVDNGPEASDDIIRITDASTYTVTFGSPVVDPLMAILSLGRDELDVRYDFDADFDILNTGTGYWGGAASGSLFEEAGNIVRGEEGHGLIRFNGTFTSISWTSDPTEFWHGFQFGVNDVKAVPEPASVLLLGLGLLGLGGQGLKAHSMKRASKKTT